MMNKIIFLSAFSLAGILMLTSAWLASRAAYYVILALLLIGFGFAEATAQNSLGLERIRGAIFDSLVFGAVLYFVTIQSVMGRTIMNHANGAEFRSHLEEIGKFSGFNKVVYYLPFFLLAGGAAFMLTA